MRSSLKLTLFLRALLQRLLLLLIRLPLMTPRKLPELRRHEVTC